MRKPHTQDEGKEVSLMKRWFSLVLLSMLLFAAMLLPAQASAAGKTAAVSQIECLQLRNDRFNAGDALKRQGLSIVDAANARVEAIIAQSCRMAERAQSDAEIRVIICSMLSRTQAVSDAARAAAALCGVRTVCEYVTVEIGGYTVEVDPIRVISV